jgi:endonuclease/exonuclease/phosphatase family metal-dependent hydrolase
VRKSSIVIVLLAALASPPAALAAPIAAVDGHDGDWADAVPVCADPAGDGARIDIGRVWVRSDSARLTLRFEVAPEISLQNGNGITLHVDGDGDASTGRAVQGLGAELSWTFGERSGTVWRGGRTQGVGQADIGLLQAPTVSSRDFEISVLRRAADGTVLIPGPVVSLVLVDEGSATGDRVPDEGSVTFDISDAPPPPPLAVSLERRHPDDVRVLTWNVLFDGLFKRPAPFTRVLRAIDPDVICFQEIWSHTARDAADQVSLALPGTTWYGENTNEGFVISRYPIIESQEIDKAGNYWALVDLPDDRYDVDLSIVSAHPACCNKEEERQEELDAIAAWLRDLVTPGGKDLPPGTPIVVAGDMNLVGGARQVRTLIAGEIANETAFGPSHPADWDGTPLADAEPRHAGGRDTYTWRDATGSFAPGRLDYIVYSDGVARQENAFVLVTEELDAVTLERYGLRAGDTIDASDHLPVVADLTLAGARARAGSAE